MTKEVWKVVPGYPEYRVSNTGRVISRKSGKDVEVGCFVTYRGKKIKVALLRKTRPAKGSYSTGIHNLVAYVFMGERVGVSRYVVHINGNTTDNRLENLRIEHKGDFFKNYMTITAATKRKGISYHDFMRTIRENVALIIDEFPIKEIHFQENG